VLTLRASDFAQDVVYGVAYSSDGKRLVAVGQLVAAGFNEPILVYDVAGGKRERKLDAQVTNGLFSVAFNRGGKVFATAGSTRSFASTETTGFRATRGAERARGLSSLSAPFPSAARTT
jgi:hypothetical protein